MAKHTGDGSDKPSLVQRFRTFLQEIREEMRKVTWPAKDEIIASTKIVFILLFAVAGIVYVYDLFFQALLFLLLRV